MQNAAPLQASLPRYAGWMIPDVFDATGRPTWIPDVYAPDVLEGWSRSALERVAAQAGATTIVGSRRSRRKRARANAAPGRRRAVARCVGWAERQAVERYG